LYRRAVAARRDAPLEPPVATGRRPHAHLGDGLARRDRRVQVVEALHVSTLDG
jgi:hypothetical protein